MPSQQRHEGYLLIDHRESPGLSDETSLDFGRPAGSGRGLFEAPTITCNHCQKVLVVNPLRNRVRGYCPKCDRYVCDECESIRARTFECKPFAQVIDEFMEAAVQAA